MKLQETLQRVDEDIATGNLGRARDRLHGLVWQYPNDLSLREKLAEVYWQLQFPAMAGCYWYLEEPTTEARQRAIAEFERACGNDPWHMLTRLKFRGDPEQLRPYARYKLERLQQECQRKYGRYPVFRARRATMVRSTLTWKQRLQGIACLLGGMLLFSTFIVGVAVVLSVIVRLCKRIFG